MKDPYSFVAPFYSVLSRTVFGYRLRAAKTVYACDLDQKRILILGGGDGLDYVHFASNLGGEYWETSSSMIQRARKNLVNSKLSFHLGHFSGNSENTFDEVWLHFVLDTISDAELPDFMSEIKISLKPKGRVFLADFFVTGNFFQRVIQEVMLLFFRITTKHSRKDLPDYEYFFKNAGFEKVEESCWNSNWIKAQLWKH